MKKLLRFSFAVILFSMLSLYGFTQTRHEHFGKRFRDNEIGDRKFHSRHRGYHHHYKRHWHRKAKHSYFAPTKRSWLGTYFYLFRPVFFWYSILHLGGTIILFFVLKSALRGREINLNFSIT